MALKRRSKKALGRIKSREFFLSAFRRADDLALAMEARCYRGGQGRTKFKPLKYGKADAAAYLLAAAYLAGVLAFRWVVG